MQLLAEESKEIKQQILQLEKEISRLRAQRKSRSPINQYSEYLGELDLRRKERLSGRLLHRVPYDKRSWNTRHDSRTPSLPSAPVSPVSKCKLIMSPRNAPKSTTTLSTQYISILTEKVVVIKSCTSTLAAFNSTHIEQLKQENSLLRKEILLLETAIAASSRKGNYRSTVGLFSSSSPGQFDRSASHRKARQSRKALEHPCHSLSRKSQMINVVSQAKRHLLQSPREEYYYRSGDES